MHRKYTKALVALAMAAVSVCAKAESPSYVGGLSEFGIANADTVLTLDCNEYVADSKTGLFYADFRKELDLAFDAQANTSLTEQVFLCKEGTRYNPAAGIMVGFDPTVERVFAEITDAQGTAHRAWAGPKVAHGQWLKVKVAGRADEDLAHSTLTLSVSADGKKWDDATLQYPGPVMPAMASQWVIGRGYPGGYPNSLQVRKGAIKDLAISGVGRERLEGENPIFTDRLTADPACTVVGDRLYAFVGEDCAGPGGWFAMPHWVAYSTTDMKHWDCHGVVLKASDFPYANPYGAWACQVVERNGKYYFYVTLDDTRNGRHAIDVAVADNPLGPYEPARPGREPLITDDMTPDSHRWNADIDPTVMIDDDGQAWIAWGNGDFYLSRLKENMVELDGEVMHLGVRNVSEGPWLFKRNGTYYLVYAADAPGVQPEQLAYSMADKITGPWTYGGLITGPARHGFTIHPSVNEFGGQWYLFYHDGAFMHDGQPGGDCRRQVCVEPLEFDDEGHILPITLTEAGVSAIEPQAVGPVPSKNQLEWQDMEMYAFIHYSLNTYTDQEWGYGNESPELFDPSDLDVKQWVKVCKDSGMKGIIFTAKHHCGFCLWPSAYTEYSVKNSPWKGGKGDVVKELADACREADLKFAVYLSPWDRNHPEYGREEYVTYFKNQLEELLTNYGDVFEVWFDGANGGDGWYGGSNEVRKIDPTTYYQWPETYSMIRRTQPHCLIWNDGSDRGDLRWVGTEAGEVGATNWSLLNKDGATDWGMLHFGLENGDSWVPGETNTSIRPGWFYHSTEDENVKSLSKLMDTYYKSVGRNSTLLLNFPIMPNGRIHPTDSIRGAAFARMVDEVFKHDLAHEAHADNPAINDGDRNTYWSPADGQVTLAFDAPVTFNRFLAEEYIPLGQRVKAWTIEARVDGEWVPLNDALTDGAPLTTIGHRRIVCFPAVTADQVRFTVTDSKGAPLISRLSVYNAPELTPDIPDSGEKKCSALRIFYMSPTQMAVELGGEKTISGIKYLPPQLSKEGIVTHYSVYATTDWANWTKVASGEFSNIVNNPIWQTVKFDPVKASVIKIEADRLSQGAHMSYSDLEILSE